MHALISSWLDEGRSNLESLKSFVMLFRRFAGKKRDGGWVHARTQAPQTPARLVVFLQTSAATQVLSVVSFPLTPSCQRHARASSP
jgi:hypothetical protein